MIDAILIVLLAASGISGIVIWSIVPGRNPLRRSVRNFHQWSGLIFLGTAFYHLFIHWNWFIKTGKKIMQNKGNQINYKYL